MSKQHPAVPAVLTAEALVRQDTPLRRRPWLENRERRLIRDQTETDLVEQLAYRVKQADADRLLRASFADAAMTQTAVVQDIRLRQHQVSVPAAQRDVDAFADLLCGLATRHYAALLEATNMRIAECATRSVSPPPKGTGWFGR